MNLDFYIELFKEYERQYKKEGIDTKEVKVYFIHGSDFFDVKFRAETEEHVSFLLEKVTNESD